MVRLSERLTTTPNCSSSGTWVERQVPVQARMKRDGTWLRCKRVFCDRSGGGNHKIPYRTLQKPQRTLQKPMSRYKIPTGRYKNTTTVTKTKEPLQKYTRRYNYLTRGAMPRVIYLCLSPLVGGQKSKHPFVRQCGTFWTNFGRLCFKCPTRTLRPTDATNSDLGDNSFCRFDS